MTPDLEEQAQAIKRDAVRHDRLRNFDAADACYRRALELVPGNKRHIERYVQFLDRWGRFAEAWDAFERWARLASPPNEWSDGRVSGRQVLLRRKIRGLGAEIRLCRLIHPVARDAASCTVVAEPRLVPLYSRSFPRARVIPAGNVPPADVSLGYEQAAGVYARTEQTLRDGFVPLVADHDAVREFRGRYQATGKLLIGFAWWSSNEGKRVPALEDWRPLLELRHCQFVSLQYGEATRDLGTLNAMAARPLIVDPSVDQLADMDRFAAQVASLDAVVMISCTAAHLAGALGVPTVVLFNDEDTQGWQHDREDSPWYPRSRVLQRRRGDAWRDLVARAAEAISEERLHALRAARGGE